MARTGEDNIGDKVALAIEPPEGMGTGLPIGMMS
jgi:hypothetical protein